MSAQVLERAFPMERTSAPQPSATAQPMATQSECAWRHSSTIGRNAGGHGEAGMESEEGTAFSDYYKTLAKK
jgi:hypothetical protein